MSRQPAPSDRGSATVLLLAATAVVATVAATILAVGTVAARRQQAATASDLAALAAASAPYDVRYDVRLADGCQRGVSVAAANGARLVDCRARDHAVDVTVAVDLPGLLAQFGPVLVRSRAGPWPPLPRPGPPVTSHT